jgi:hypothetical protein
VALAPLRGRVAIATRFGFKFDPETGQAEAERIGSEACPVDRGATSWRAARAATED